MPDIALVKTALVSVFDKTGIVEFCSQLHAMGVKIISTGGTANLLRENKVPVQEVSEYTGFPEILDGRVKTLNPMIHAGILFRRGLASDEKTIKERKVTPIDMVVVNVYSPEKEIDIGGPAMIRAAAKNHEFVTIVTDSADYPGVVSELREYKGTRLETRKKLAGKAFALTAGYDAQVTQTFATETFPKELVLGLTKVQDLRYGENPHQQAAWYANPTNFLGLKQLAGKQLSYNNILDVDASLGIAKEFSEPVAVIVKHTNPCGVAIASSLTTAFKNALATDEVSAFGGILAFNRTVDASVADTIGDKFVEIILAPAFDGDAKEILEKKKSRRIIEMKEYFDKNYNKILFRSALGGMLAQSPDASSQEKFEVITKKKPSEEEKKAALFGWKVAKHVKSNAVIFSTADRTIGIGAGQMSRVDSCKIAVEKAKTAGLSVKGTAMASDAFFPFRDTVDYAAQAGCSIIIQPGGSIRDAESISAADEHGLPMILTGVRHFRH